MTQDISNDQTALIRCFIELSRVSRLSSDQRERQTHSVVVTVVVESPRYLN